MSPYISHGDKCLHTYHEVVNAMKTKEGKLLQTKVLDYLQGGLEEIDTPPNTLIAFNAMSSGNILVRSTHTDLLSILVRSTHTEVLAILVKSTHTDVLTILVKSTHTDVRAILLGLVDVPAVTSLCLLVVQFQNL